MADSEVIRKLLKAQQAAAVDDGAGDVVFAVFLEPHASSDTGFFDKLISYVVNNWQPSPVMTHVELVVPGAPKSDAPVHFSTYISDRSAWRVDRSANEGYYLGSTAGKWRAIPVFGSHAARLAREACNRSCDVEYSLCRYFTAAYGVRALAAAVPDGPRQPAHCATLTARVLRSAVGLRHPSAWYGPASLYAELRADLHRTRLAPEAAAAGHADAQVDRLLRHRAEDVRRMSSFDFNAAVRALTVRAASAVATGEAETTQVTAQKQLATGLFRWSILRAQN